MRRYWWWVEGFISGAVFVADPKTTRLLNEIFDRSVSGLFYVVNLRILYPNVFYGVRLLKVIFQKMKGR